MNKGIVIFGNKDFAELAKFYIENDPPHYHHVFYNSRVCAFTVDDEYVTENSFNGLPVIPLSELEKHHPPDEYHMFAPMSHSNMNGDRKSVVERLESKNYKMINYVSSKATVLSKLPSFSNLFILEDNTIQPFVKVGKNIVMWSGNHIGHHSTIGDDVFFTSHVVLSGHCKVGNGSFFGVNSTIRDGVKIGEKSLVSMGALITKDTDSCGVYMGVPAKKIKTIDEVG